MAFFQAHAGGLDVSVRATPKGGRDALDGVVQLSDGRDVLKIRVRAAPEDGAATEAVARVLAKAAGVAASRVALVSGATARLKLFRITGEPATLEAALTRAVSQD
ncbi:DUF167 family protein [Roseixanthobacter glucoisosaccharinicivorans]|uniref:DUF167 family protein n=1 Tax=Roseixanthobacter glucoisosaccharinicivorans TaxID=3119923 RepID=UPI00372B9B33